MFDFIGKLVFFSSVFLAGDLIGISGVKHIVMTFIGG